MTTYELTFLVEDPKSLTKLEEVLTTFGGKKIKELPWGKRLLEYPIEKQSQAEYYTWHITIDKNKLNELKIKLNYDKVVLRYLFLMKEEATTEPKK